MDTNIILCGVGGQGILSIAYVLDNAALSEGFQFKQSEVHGMSQRGGAVQSHLRFSTGTLWSDLVPEGAADLILSVEPLESLRYAHFLQPEGWIVSSADPFVNIPDYPDLESVFPRIQAFRHVLLDADALARLAGSGRASNMVMLGAGSVLLPLEKESCLAQVRALFESKGEKTIGVNIAAFQFGRVLSAYYIELLKAGVEPGLVRRFIARVDPRQVELASAPTWVSRLKEDASFLESAGERFPATIEQAAR